MKRVLTYSSYVPEAWVSAHGCELVRFRPQGGVPHDCVARVEGLCPYTQAWVSDVLSPEKADAIVMTTCCDQMRRAFEVVSRHADLPCFLLNLPHVWQTDSAFQSYQDELRRLGRFLENLSGGGFSEDRLSHLLAHEQEAHGSLGPNVMDRLPLALVGSHGMVHDDVLKALIEQQGGCVVSDDTEPLMPQVKADPGHAFDAMCAAHWEAMADVFQRPNTRLYERLARLLKQRSVAGVIVRRYLWCDLWHAEVACIKAWSPVPVLDIEVSSPAQTDQHRLATRIGAFMEMIA
jgi:benzoyl-CoA reductase/2-hydroxyglutaryl-CoA dehydratase subunit BcrC/BadD/HgdB